MTLAQYIADHGGLIGANAAASMLGIAHQNLRRDIVGRGLLHPIPVAGSADVYSSTEVWTLAKRRMASRDQATHD